MGKHNFGEILKYILPDNDFGCVIARRRMAYTPSSLCLAKIIIWKYIPINMLIYNK